MKKLLIGLAIASALGVSGCDDETIADIEKENNVVSATGTDTSFAATSRVTFDPSNEKLSFPNDLLLFTDSQDLTLNLPVAEGDDQTKGNPVVAANSLDGWSTHQPFVLGFEFADGVTLDPASLFDIGAIDVYEAVMGLDQSDADCTPLSPAIACKGVKKLVLAEDYIVQAMGSDLAFVPLKPLKAKTTYIISLTNRLLDTEGNSIDGSATYNLVKQDIVESPFSDPSLYGLQGMINSYENIAAGFGANKEEIIYTMAMTTQSVGDVMSVAKQLIVSDLADKTTATYSGVKQTGITAAHLLFTGPDDNLIQHPVMESLQDPRYIFTAASVLAGKVKNARYYSALPTAENQMAPLNQEWKAMCDSGVMLALADPAIFTALNPGMYDEACQNFGLRDFRDEQGVPTFDTERNLTKFNPIPELVEHLDLDMVMTVPNLDTVNDIRASFLLPEIEKPENGWPVVMLQHGFGMHKEQMLSLSGMLSVYGFATAAIDHPLHGLENPLFSDSGAGRGFGPMNATENPTAYMNLASLLTARDNLRQSVVDTLTMRMALNNVYDVTIEDSPMPAGIDGSNVYYAGLSLGAITGLDFMALTNTSLGNSNPLIDPDILDPMFKVNAALLSVPGGGIGNFLLESPAYSPLIKGSLAYAGSEEFQGFVAADGGANNIGDIWTAFESVLTDEQKAGFDGTFAEYTFAAQSILDSADPLNYAAALAENDSNILVHTVVGNGTIGTNLEDQVIPTFADAAGSQLSGSNPLISQLGLSVISDEIMNEGGVSAAVKFVNGHHSSLVNPADEPYSINEGLVTQEMQTQMAVFFASKGTYIKVNDAELVLK